MPSNSPISLVMERTWRFKERSTALICGCSSRFCSLRIIWARSSRRHRNPRSSIVSLLGGYHNRRPSDFAANNASIRASTTSVFADRPRYFTKLRVRVPSARCAGKSSSTQHSRTDRSYPPDASQTMKGNRSMLAALSSRLITETVFGIVTCRSSGKL